MSKVLSFITIVITLLFVAMVFITLFKNMEEQVEDFCKDKEGVYNFSSGVSVNCSESKINDKNVSQNGSFR